MTKKEQELEVEALEGIIQEIEELQKRAFRLMSIVKQQGVEDG